ncbi:cardiolipin synthase ClsB [Rhodoferax saidenbachensis]|uniref:cardiolipin synthase ClsB n=1 Tax=Rhodoferax saidenbachensis TaxID=1484693 RepID=UPI0038F6E2DE
MPYTPGHHLALLQGGTEYFPALIAAIDASTQEVRLETYIFNFDTQGEGVAQALMQAAQRGVQVMVVVDGVGTPEVPLAWRQRWNSAGVHWHRFKPLGRLGLLIPGRWRRLHRKLAVVDGRVAFCGGINVLDDWYDPYYGKLESPRFDFAVQVQGPLVADVHRTMRQFWGRLQATRQLERLQWAQAKASLVRATQATRTESAGPGDVAGSPAALVLRDNVRNRARIERAYRKALGAAQHEVIIANAYFLPGGKLRRALMHAARRGVRVCLLLNGEYEYFMQYHGARPVYGALLEAGVEIHEYSTGFLHAKVAVVDGQWATVGSSNLDPLSLLLAREANVVVQDAAFATQLRQSLLQAIAQHGRKLEGATHARRPLGQRALDWLAYGLMRLTLMLTGRRY